MSGFATDEAGTDRSLRPWWEAPTGLFSHLGPVARHPSDPALALVAGRAQRRAGAVGMADVGGAGWTMSAALGAAVGEGLERWIVHPLPRDSLRWGRYDQWEWPDAAMDPERFVGFLPEQHAQAGFPYAPLTRESSCRWVRMRRVRSGRPVWVPADQVYLHPGAESPQSGLGRHLVAVSTGLAVARTPGMAIRRGLQEVVERDAMVGAWWRRYPLVRVDPSVLDPHAAALDRPHLEWKTWRILSPYGEHVALVTVSGEGVLAGEHRGWCFGVGTACRETAAAAFEKAALEAFQTWAWIRQLDPRRLAQTLGSEPTGFEQHAAWYSVHPDRLVSTPLHDAPAGDIALDEQPVSDLLARLGELGPLYRIMTPPVEAALDAVVVRVVVPGLQPLWGHRRLAPLGGPLWGRSLAAFADWPPHPFA